VDRKEQVSTLTKTIETQLMNTFAVILSRSPIVTEQNLVITVYILVPYVPLAALLRKLIF
jgi:hypothetical protein